VRESGISVAKLDAMKTFKLWFTIPGLLALAACADTEIAEGDAEEADLKGQFNAEVAGVYEPAPTAPGGPRICTLHLWADSRFEMTIDKEGKCLAGKRVEGTYSALNGTLRMKAKRSPIEVYSYTMKQSVLSLEGAGTKYSLKRLSNGLTTGQTTKVRLSFRNVTLRSPNVSTEGPCRKGDLTFEIEPLESSWTSWRCVDGGRWTSGGGGFSSDRQLERVLDSLSFAMFVPQTTSGGAGSCSLNGDRIVEVTTNGRTLVYGERSGACKGVHGYLGNLQPVMAAMEDIERDAD
jgi:hypothetical protein